MGWFSTFLTSSIGQKLVMALTGLFLVLFLVIHLAGNLQLLFNDSGEAFNIYAYTMTHNPVIKVVSYGTYFFILLHAVQGIILAVKNRQARGKEKYAVKKTRVVRTNRFAANNMALLGTLILAFLGIHMGDFWWQMKMQTLPMVAYEGMEVEVQDLYTKVYASFKEWWLVGIYLISMIVLAYHLLHGFQSAFQTLGLNHKKYTPFIKAFGKFFAIVIPFLFALIPLIMFFFR